MPKNTDSNAYRHASDAATRGELIVAAAISTVDFSKYDTLDAVETAVLRRVSTISKRFMNPKSTAMRLLDAVPIQCTITDVSYEESSTRYVITFKPDVPFEGADSDTETIRSDRTDGFGGDRVKAMWHDAAGKRATIYKTTEETGNPRKPVCRIAPYVDIHK